MSHSKMNKCAIAVKLSLVVGTAVLAAPTFAQQAAADGAKDQNVEVIEVRGIRRSLSEAANVKRFADAVVDAVSAEDIGQLPDSDVGQALGRIPGITVGRSFGQGSSVTIRGTDPLMTLTTLNGQNVASTGWYDQMNIDRSFNYSLLPPELIGGMEVYKSTQANLVEGGIGGTVIVKTRKPLDLEANTAFVTLKGEYGTVNKDVAPEFSGLYAWKNDSETFGVLVSGAMIDREYLRRGTEADLDWGGRSSIQPSSFLQEQERRAVDVTAQWKPAENLELGAHVLMMKLGADSLGANMYINTDTDWGDGPSNCTKFNAAGVCVISNTPASRSSKVFFQNWARQGEMTSDTLELNGKYTGDGYELSAVAGSTKAEGGTDMTANFGYGWWGDKFGKVTWNGSVDATGHQININGKDMGFGINDLDTTVGTSTWTGVQGPNSDEEQYLQLDLDKAVDLGIFNKFETGVRVTSHEFEKKEYRAIYDPAKKNEFKTTDLYSGTMPLGYQGWTIPKGNPDAMIAATNSLVKKFAYSRPGYALLEEDNFAAYGMLSFNGDSYRGNLGLRYVSTDVTSTGHAINGVNGQELGQNNGWAEGTFESTGDYAYALPSANISFDIAPDLILRLSAGEAITRPTYDSLFTAKLDGYPDDRRGNEQITYGNPDLNPMKASQFDASIEYYYGPSNLFSVTYFKKSISDFIVSKTQFNQKIGVVNNDLLVPADSWTVNKQVNAGGGKISGFELQLNHSFGNGFGIASNYTFANAEAPAEVYTDRLSLFTESSKNSANLVGYWEDMDYSARLAYNWRSKYMIREYGRYYGNRMHDDFGTLDLTLGWNVTENAKLRLEATNLLEEDDVQYGAAAAGTDVKPALQDGFPTWSFIGEAMYKVSVTYAF